jgi:hypothetical protein
MERLYFYPIRIVLWLIPTFNSKNEASDSPLITSKFYVYPNPAQNDFFIRTTLSAPYYLEIISLQGRLVEQLVIADDGLIVISAAQFPAGTYVIRLMAEEEIRTNRLIIIH